MQLKKLFKLQIKIFEKESKVIKKLKLYFSYLMITLNLGLNISNLRVNYDMIIDKANEMKISTIGKINSIYLDNPFSEKNKDLLVTLEDAKVNILMEAFKKNPHINDEDLEIALSLREYLEENPYADYEELYEIFATMGIVHSKNFENDTIAGTYSHQLNTIQMFKNSFKTEERYEDTLQHELIHSTGNLDNTLLNEGMTTILQMEYSNDEKVNNIYYDHILVTKIFCELITPEKMLEAYTKKDMNIIKKEMLELNPNEKYYNKLIKSMEKYSEEYQNIHWGFISNPTVSQEDVPSYQFYKLLEPYYSSDKISIEAKEEIRHYIEEIGYWMNEDSKIYFNKENTKKENYK